MINIKKLLFRIGISNCLFLFFFLSACISDEEHPVPKVPVYIELTFSNDLNKLGSGEVLSVVPDTLNPGYSIIKYGNKYYPDNYIKQRTYGNGILLYREGLIYWAYDITCPYRVSEDNCSINIKDRGVLPICNCCNSVFMLNMDGIPAKGSKAKFSLRRYKTWVDDHNNVLVISN